MKAGLSSKTLNKVLTALTSLSVAEKLPLIGCEEHHLLLTQQLIYFYSTTRMYFASRVERLHNVSIEKAKSMSKQTKLIVRPNARKNNNVSQAKNVSNIEAYSVDEYYCTSIGAAAAAAAATNRLCVCYK